MRTPEFLVGAFVIGIATRLREWKWYEAALLYAGIALMVCGAKA